MSISDLPRTVLAALCAVVAGVCVAHCATNDACLRYSDCDDGLTCADGRCVVPPAPPVEGGTDEASVSTPDAFVAIDAYVADHAAPQDAAEAAAPVDASDAAAADASLDAPDASMDSGTADGSDAADAAADASDASDASDAAEATDSGDASLDAPAD